MGVSFHAGFETTKSMRPGRLEHLQAIKTRLFHAIRLSMCLTSFYEPTSW